MTYQYIKGEPVSDHLHRLYLDMREHDPAFAGYLLDLEMAARDVEHDAGTDGTGDSSATRETAAAAVREINSAVAGLLGKETWGSELEGPKPVVQQVCQTLEYAATALTDLSLDVREICETARQFQGDIGSPVKEGEKPTLYDAGQSFEACHNGYSDVMDAMSEYINTEGKPLKSDTVVEFVAAVRKTVIAEALEVVGGLESE